MTKQLTQEQAVALYNTSTRVAAMNRFARLLEQAIRAA